MIEQGLQAMEERDIKVLRTSSLWETEPMYVQDQGRFLNAVCEVTTDRDPCHLLRQLKGIETSLGRRKEVEKGPRTIDLDILLYDQDKIQTEHLVIPHPSMLEREFVLRPLCELEPHGHLPSDPGTTFHHALAALATPTTPMSTVTPLSRGGQGTAGPTYRPATRLMAILNVTPDSFSDGGLHLDRDGPQITKVVSVFVAAGATVIDIGGQSTRPGAHDVGEAEELARVLPVVRAIRASPRFNAIPLSVDTYRARVAEESIAAGADMINDISGGMLDPAMLPTVAKLRCTLCLMHMRGTPTTMTQHAAYPDGTIQPVGTELLARVRAAEAAGVRRWRLMLDPGIGFAKYSAHNLEILRRLPDLRMMPGLQHLPWLVGTSRKAFIGSITNSPNEKERLWGTAVAVSAAVAGGADMVRIHDVPEMRKVVKMADSIWRSRESPFL
ncbi:MAG: trifunctional dihydropteroate synthetase [Phylliscum demangeonii]|nr:MAG: trifunctional dihydropteroate synthetase [Phylliscum demangeonii]